MGYIIENKFMQFAYKLDTDMYRLLIITTYYGRPTKTYTKNGV